MNDSRESGPAGGARRDGCCAGTCQVSSSASAFGSYSRHKSTPSLDAVAKGKAKLNEREKEHPNMLSNAALSVEKMLVRIA
jgi:hypothetical protein